MGNDLPKPGDILAGNYVVRARIGEGGMGHVFRADDTRHARPVAIKMVQERFRGDPWVLRRFRDEVEMTDRVKHAAVPTVLDSALDGEVPFFVMELVTGRSLGHILAEEILPVERALAIVDRILDALCAVHAAGVIHADLKSDNILVEACSEGDAVKLIDFGLARQINSVVDGEIVSGTPEYMAPELVRGQPPTRASDLYAVAVILYELLTGKTPFAGGSPSEILTRQLDACIVPPSQRTSRAIPAALDAVLLRALAKDSRERYPDAGALRRALADVVVAPRRRLRVRERADAPRVEPSERETRRQFANRRRLARGSDANALVRREARTLFERTIARALLCGDGTAVAEGYLAFADHLARAGRGNEAIRELEEAIEVLPEGLSHDRLVLALGALHARLGRVDTVRELLVEPDGRATQPDLPRTTRHS